MAKKLAIPEDRREWPDWEYRPFPKWLGRDELGNDLTAKDEDEAAAMKPRVVYPKPVGLDAKGNVLQAMHPDEESIKKAQVKAPLPDAAPAAEAVDLKATRKGK